MTTPGVLPRSTPEAQGVPSAALLALVARLESQGCEPHSLMVLRHGHVIAEGWWAPYHRDGVQLLYSLSKSFTSSAVGLAVAERRFALDDRLSSFFPSAARPAGPRARELTVHHALSMSTGHRADTLPGMEADPEHGFFAAEPAEPPGTWFVYNNGATFMAGAVVQQCTEQRLLDYLRPRLFDPLGITTAAWHQVPDGRDQGFSGLHLSTEAVARFGQLISDDGRFAGRQVLPAGWVATATSALTDNSMNDATTDWQLGYGYQFWRGRHGSVRGDGAYGQLCVVLPEQDTVVVVTAATPRMDRELDLVWELLPALGPKPLPADGAAVAALTQRLAAAAIPVVTGDARPDRSGPWTFRREPGGDHPELSALTVHAADAGFALQVDDGAELHIRCGTTTWPAADSPFVATGGWTDPSTFTARIVAVQTPHHLVLTGDLRTGTLSARWNVVPLWKPVLATLIAGDQAESGARTAVESGSADVPAG